MTSFVRELVRQRAGERCEYCHLPQNAIPHAPFHIEHVIAVQHGGPDHEHNLALACDRCNAYKGPNLSAIDPETNTIVQLFNPRQQQWSDHFAQHGFDLVGLTQVGRATVRLFNMNAPRRVQLRRALRIRCDTDE